MIFFLQILYFRRKFRMYVEFLTFFEGFWVLVLVEIRISIFVDFLFTQLKTLSVGLKLTPHMGMSVVLNQWFDLTKNKYSKFPRWLSHNASSPVYQNKKQNTDLIFHVNKSDEKFSINSEWSKLHIYHFYNSSNTNKRCYELHLWQTRSLFSCRRFITVSTGVEQIISR